jgi:hypothetical protein
MSNSHNSRKCFAIRNDLLLVSSHNPTYAATWATFILASRLTINLLIVMQIKVSLVSVRRS